ncbi:hypothetical protein CEXT_456931 [Caerostris extrusa]|uniref:Uncharacterized protein n=1 Tax=Caerostris extrusa TaxID=172846 RepID=A0AAV4MIC1_CAEEX|nr:hypothetical protein CEXT_456931 [Caerostris extrusa]
MLRSSYRLVSSVPRLQLKGIREHGFQLLIIGNDFQRVILKTALKRREERRFFLRGRRWFACSSNSLPIENGREGIALKCDLQAGEHVFVRRKEKTDDMGPLGYPY